MHHLTHINNLKDILENNLNARTYTPHFVDTALKGIVDKRNLVDGFNLNSYVPFHLNHMQIKYEISYNHSVIEGKEDEMIFLIFDFKNIKNKYQDILYYVYHPVSIFKIKCSSLDEMVLKIKTEAEKLPKYSSDRLSYTKQSQELFMSEILVKQSVDSSFIKQIIVHSKNTKDYVEEILKTTGFSNEIVVIIDTKYKFFKK